LWCGEAIEQSERLLAQHAPDGLRQRMFLTRHAAAQVDDSVAQQRGGLVVIVIEVGSTVCTAATLAFHTAPHIVIAAALLCARGEKALFGIAGLLRINLPRPLNLANWIPDET
jgi:hypothetical protein